MSEPRPDTLAVVRRYYEILRAGPEAFETHDLLAILDPELDFEGPIAGRRVGAEPFARGVAGFVGAARSLELLEQVYSGEHAATLYDAELPGGAVRFAEFIHVVGGRIVSLRLLYDAALYRARGGG